MYVSRIPGSRYERRNRNRLPETNFKMSLNNIRAGIFGLFQGIRDLYFLVSDIILKTKFMGQIILKGI